MAKQKITYEEAMAQIEQILADLRSGECGVDRLTAEVKRATELMGHGYTIVGDACDGVVRVEDDNKFVPSKHLLG